MPRCQHCRPRAAISHREGITSHCTVSTGACGFNDYEMADMGSSGVNGRIDTAGASEIAERAVKQMAKTGGHVTSDTIAETLVQETPIAWPSSKGDPRPVQWPKASKEPVPENTMYYLVGAFPLRFMNTHADLNANRRIKVTMEEYFEGLLYYWDGERYPFACHPTFRYVALNMTFRHHAWNRAVVFANRQLPANISVATIQEQVRHSTRDSAHDLTSLLAHTVAPLASRCVACI